jgi:AraC family transcriptional regulator, regulatory protein of adaptative response / methylated-DNA-[protein]-cysteine methyltransferase
METSALNYARIAKAIEFIRLNFKEQPELDDIASELHLSSFHFQRIFREWAGTTPKKFLQYVTVEHAKKLLKENRATLSEATEASGLSGTSRLHDLFINIEGMTPAEYKHGGRNLQINYSFAESPFGNVLVASTQKGICYMAFTENEIDGLADLTSIFPQATFSRRLDLRQQNALFIFQNDWTRLSQVKLHLKGTEFQLKVWEALLKIPVGQLTTYQAIAKQIRNPLANRAVGTAIGHNPVAYLIPCHRVIQQSGNLGGYMWGSTRKAAIIGWESTKYFGDGQA